MRYLDESPWERLRKASKAMKGHSLLSALSRGRNLFGYVPYPDSVLEGFYKEAIKNGLNVMRIFDALNDLDNVKESIRMINQLGGIPDGAVCYTVDPKDEDDNKGFFGSRFFSKKPEKIFTDEYFVEKARAMEAYGAKIITLSRIWPDWSIRHVSRQSCPSLRPHLPCPWTSTPTVRPVTVLPHRLWQ